LRLPATIAKTGLGRDSIYRGAREGWFPKPVKLSERASGWFEDEPDDTPEIDEAAEAEPIESDEEAGDEAAPAGPADDLGVDFAEDDEAAEGEDDDSVPFLEDEDDDFADDEIEGIGEDDGEEH